MPSPPVELSDLLGAQDLSSKEQAWAHLLERYSGLLLHAARRFGASYDEAMDRYSYMVEELRRDDSKRLRAFESDGPGKFSTWLLVVAHRLCQDFHRKRYGRRRDTSNEQSPARSARAVRWRLQDFVVEDVERSLTPADLDDPDLRLRTAELQSAVEGAKAGLGARDRLLLHYRFTDNRSVVEITSLMRYPTVFHVHRRLRKLMGELRRRLQDAGHDTPAP